MDRCDDCNREVIVGGQYQNAKKYYCQGTIDTDMSSYYLCIECEADAISITTYCEESEQ